MRIYSTSSAVVTTIRKEGFYMSSRVARTTSKRLASLLELDDTYVRNISSMLSGSPDGFNWCSRCMTPADYRVVFNLMDWWAKDSSGEIDANAKAFFAVNLNTGACITFLDRK